MSIRIISTLFLYSIFCTGYAQMSERIEINEKEGNPLVLKHVDFDLDGDEDLLEVNTYESLNLFLNNGDGSFGSKINLISDLNYNYSAVEISFNDFNSDGYPDILFLGNDLYLLMNDQGLGILDPILLVQDASNIGYIQSADFEADGDIDIFYYNGSQGKVAIRKNNGSNSFASEIYWGTFATTRFYALTDIDSDNDLDIFFYNSNNTIKKSLYLGNNLFSMPATVLSVNIDFLIAEFKDINADNKPDFFYWADDHFGYIEANTSGSFNAPVDYFHSSTSLFNPELGYYNEDDFLDVIYFDSWTDSLISYNYMPPGQFSAAISHPYTSAPVSAYFSPADFNGDGRIDFACVTDLSEGNVTHDISICLQNDDDSYSISEVVKRSVAFYYGPVFSDIDHDGLQDIIINDDQILIFHNSGENGFDEPVAIIDERETSVLRVFDFNGDSFDDIIYGQRDTLNVFKIMAMLNDETGSFDAPFVLTDAISMYNDFDVLDVDSDQDADIVVNFSHGMIFMEQVEPGIIFQHQLDSIEEISKRSFIDFDGDQDMDVIYKTDLDIRIARFDSTGNFGVEEILVDSVGNIAYTDVFDVNGDTIYDLVFLDGNNFSSRIWVASGIGGGLVNSPEAFDYNYEYNWIHGDFDFDGDIDLCYNTYTPDLNHFNLVLNNNGNLDQTIQQWIEPGADNRIIVYYPTDLNMDGLIDIVVCSEFNMFYYLNTGEGCMDPLACNFNPNAINPGDCTYPSTGADFNCDGVSGVDDLLLVLANFGCIESCELFDIDGNGSVGVSDLMIIIGNF